jgi:hypothetical protein
MQRQSNVPEQENRIIVGFVQLNPSEAAIVFPSPLTQRGGLAVPRRGDYQDQRHGVRDAGEGPQRPVAAHVSRTIQRTTIFGTVADADAEARSWGLSSSAAAPL